jgi:1-acyl-sn-glycerol-3-phosphate acyltransferase
MAKGVLGNDPFLRGAAAREETEIKTPPKPAPKTPEPKPIAPAKPRLPPRPAAAAQKAPAPGSRGWPKAADKNKPARESVRELMSKAPPVPIKPPAPSAPVLETPPERLAKWEPTSHPGSPQMVILVDGIATAHSGSPDVILQLGQLGQPPGRIKEFVPHPNTPELKAVLSRDVVPDSDSPGPGVAHHGSPEVVADLAEQKAVAHSLSPEAVEVHAATRRPSLVVAITERSGPDVPMSDREISAVPRSSRPVLALDAARDIFSGSMRPLAGAARGIFSAARTALGLGGAGDLDVWGKDLSLTRSLEPLSDFLYDKYFRVTVDGADHVPSGAVILVANHSGALPLDGPMLHLALRRERADLPDARWLMEDQVFHAPFVGVLANRLGAVRANPENATRLLEEKRPVAVFPEGIQGISKRFGQRYQLKRFGRGGYVKLAVRLKVPIVPVAIVGAEESMPLLARLPASLFGLPYLPITVPPLPAKWHIRFGAPIDLSHAPDNAEADLAWVAQTNDRTRETIEGMLTAMLRSRTSVF